MCFEALKAADAEIDHLKAKLKETESKLREATTELREATTDTITHAPLRWAAIKYLQSVDCPVTLAFIDVDDLKEINDSWGHAAGDQLLMAVVVHVIEALPAAFVARVGGDEFIAVSTDIAPEEMVGRLREACGQHGFIQGHDVPVRFSFGVARGPWEEALLEADYLEQVAKAQSHNRLPELPEQSLLDSC